MRNLYLCCIFSLVSVLVEHACAQSNNLDVNVVIQGAPGTDTLSGISGSLSAQGVSVNSGSYAESQASAGVVACPAGYYCAGDVSSPVPCPAGTYQPTSTASSAFQCLGCPTGAYCLAGVSATALCSAGTYQPSQNATSSAQCQVCPAGYYCLAGASATTACPAGTYQP